MSLYRILLRSLRRGATATTAPQTISVHYAHYPLQNPILLVPVRSFAFSSAEEAAAERRRRKRRLRIEPPINALRNPGPPPQRDPNAPKLPDSTSNLVGPRLNLHNRVQSLIRAGDLDAASVVARQSVFSNTRPTVFTCNAIIAAMYRASRYNDAIALFQYFFRQFNIIPNVVSYNMLIVTHCEMGNVDEGLKIYQHILAEAPFSPSPVTYRHLTKGLVEADRIGEAVDLLREMLNKGHGADSLVYNNLISGFLKLENLDKANELFDELKERCLVYDGVVNATFMDWFFNQGREKEAMESYKSLLDRQFKMVPATCNVLLEVLLKHGRKTEAWALFDKMLDDHKHPTFQAVNSDTYSLMVNECFKLGKISEAYDVFKKAGKTAKSTPFAMDVAGFSNMIARYCEHEMMEDAEKIFAELCGKSLNPDVTIYKNLIDAYMKLERVDDALHKYTKMVEAGLRVITRYANKWFSFLIEKGRTTECGPILTKMCEREPKPDATTYDLVIRALCNEGNFDMSLDLVGQMMRFGVGVPPMLRELLLEAFGKEGRRQELEKIIFVRYPSNSQYPPRYAAPTKAYPVNEPIPSEFPRTTAQVSGYPDLAPRVAASPQRAAFEPSQTAGQVSGPPRTTNQVPGYPFAASSQGHFSDSYQMSRHVPGPPGTFGGVSRYPNPALRFSGPPQGQTFEPSQVAGQVSEPSIATSQLSGHSHMGSQFSGNFQAQASPLSKPEPPQTTFQGSGTHQMTGQKTEPSQTGSYSSGLSHGSDVFSHPQTLSQISSDFQMTGRG